MDPRSPPVPLNTATPLLPGLGRVLCGLIGSGIRIVGFLLHAILATFEPVVRFVLLLLALAGIATCVVYGLLLRDPRFPLGILLLFSLAMCVLSALYGLIVRLLSPD
jgi:hypothetical protein